MKTKKTTMIVALSLFVITIMVFVDYVSGCGKTEANLANPDEIETLANMTEKPEDSAFSKMDAKREEYLKLSDASWNEYVQVEEEFCDNIMRESIAAGDFRNPDIGHVADGKYVDLYETSHGVVAMDKSGELWKICTQQVDGTLTFNKEKLCDLMKDASSEEVEIGSYADAFQRDDLIFFAKNGVLYSCHLLTAEIAPVCDLKSQDEKYQYVYVVGGTDNGVLLKTSSVKDKLDGDNLFWDWNEKSLKKIQWEEEGLSVDYYCGYLGHSGNEMFYTNGYQIYGANVVSGEYRALTENGYAWSDEEEQQIGETSSLMYGNYGAIIDGKLHYLSPNKYKDETSKIIIWFNALYGLPTQGVESNTMIDSVKSPTGNERLYAKEYRGGENTYFTETDVVYEREEDIKAFYCDGETVYVLITHVGSNFPEDEQGSIIYTLDLETKEIVPVTNVLQGMNRPAQMIVKDEIAYIISSDGREIYVTQIKVTLEEIGFQVPSIENVQSIEWVTGGVPAYATKKTIIEAEDVQHIMDMLNDIQPQRVAVEEEYTLNGGIGHHIRVNCTDGQRMTLKLASTNVLQWNENYYIIEDLNYDLSEEWDSLPYEEELIREEGLNDFLSKDTV